MFCDLCGKESPCLSSTSFWQAPKILVVQLKRYSNLNGFLSIDRQIFNVSDTLSIVVPTIIDSVVSFNTTFKLVAQICHSGSLQSGHYFANVLSGNKWLKCNDRAVTEIGKSALDNSYSYLLFFKLV